SACRRSPSTPVRPATRADAAGSPAGPSRPPAYPATPSAMPPRSAPAPSLALGSGACRLYSRLLLAVRHWFRHRTRRQLIGGLIDDFPAAAVSVPERRLPW